MLGLGSTAVRPRRRPLGGGERSLACKEMEYEKAELRMLFLREKKDYMF